MEQKFSERLSRMMAERGLRASALASAADLDKSYLSNLLSGAKTNPSKDVTRRLANVLGLHADWLATGAGPKELPVGSGNNVQETPDVDNDGIKIVVREGPAIAARRMSPEELISRIQEHAGKLRTDHDYMRAAHAETIVALARELYLRPISVSSKP